MWPFTAYKVAPRDDNLIARRTLREFQMPVSSVFGTGIQTRKMISAGFAGGAALPTGVISGVPGIITPAMRQVPLNQQ